MLYQTKNPHGGSVDKKIKLDYSANINPFGTPPQVIEAMRTSLSSVRHYPDPYCSELIQEIAHFEKIPAEYFLCGNGAAELIYAYCNAVKPETAGLAAPTFSEYEAALKPVGTKIISYSLQQANNFDLDNRFFDFLCEHKMQVLFLCNPNNPTGRLIPQSILEDTLDYCRSHRTKLFLDESFISLSEQGVSMKGFLKEYPELFILKSLTKSYGLAGVRLGYCMCADTKLLFAISNVTQQWNVSSVAQAAGIAALKRTEFLAESTKVIFTERQWLQKQLESLGFFVCPSHANYILFKAARDLDVQLQKKGIAIRNCANYKGLGEGWYRIAVKQHFQNEQLIEAIHK